MDMPDLSPAAIISARRSRVVPLPMARFLPCSRCGQECVINRTSLVWVERGSPIVCEVCWAANEGQVDQLGFITAEQIQEAREFGLALPAHVPPMVVGTKYLAIIPGRNRG